MKKKYIAALAAGAAAGAWCVYRDRKYPVCRPLRFANKLAVPGWAVSLGTARLSNRLLGRMPLPAPPQGVESWGTQFSAADGTSVRLTLYAPNTAEGYRPRRQGGRLIGFGYLTNCARSNAEYKAPRTPKKKPSGWTSLGKGKDDDECGQLQSCPHSRIFLFGVSLS